MISYFHQGSIYNFPMLTEMHLDKFDIFFQRYAFEVQGKGTLVKRAIGTIKHIDQ